MVAGDGGGVVESSVLAAALRAVDDALDVDTACRAGLAEGRTSIPFAVGLVLRSQEAGGARVWGVSPAPIAGLERDVVREHTAFAERTLQRLGEPSLDGELRPAVGDRSALTRLSAFGIRSALRIPLFGG